jgi:hypothetical protein
VAHLTTPAKPGYEVKGLTEFLQALSAWQSKHMPAGGDEGFLSQLWYRGVNEAFSEQRPGVCRSAFTARASKLTLDKVKDDEDKRLHLEREILSQFRTAGAVFLRDYTEVEIYFAAQHHRIPTRLLDWSTNPLAGLFFACDGEPNKDGFVYAMDARKVIQLDAKQANRERLYQAVMTMRHPYVRYAVGLSFWNKPKDDHPPHVLPVRPDVVPGRIGQQSSAFTLHMHRADDITNPTLAGILVKAASKGAILDDLHKLNINQFTTYYDLDHLSAETKVRWGLSKR